MAQLVRYQTLEPIFFKLTLSGAGVSGITLLSADVQYHRSIDGGVFTVIGADCSEIGLGWYKYTPGAVTITETPTVVINIKATGGNVGLFDENGIILLTGGHNLAYYDADL